jgi:hypothetical protein
MKTASISVNKPPFAKILLGMYQKPRVDVSWKKAQSQKIFQDSPFKKNMFKNPIS